MNFVLQILVFTSLGTVIYLLARALPRVGDLPSPERKPNFLDRMISKVPMAKIDESLDSFFAKTLRKIKVLILKIDNFINDRLGKLSKKSNNDKGGDGDQQLL